MLRSAFRYAIDLISISKLFAVVLNAFRTCVVFALGFEILKRTNSPKHATAKLQFIVGHLILFRLRCLCYS